MPAVMLFRGLCLLIPYLPPTNEVAKVMFSVMSVCPQVTTVWTCSNLLNLGPQCTGPTHTPLPPPHANMLKLVHYEARTVDKRAVDIQLKCILVIVCVHKLPSTGFHCDDGAQLNVCRKRV